MEYIKCANGTISVIFEKVNKNLETITTHLQAIDKELNLLNAKVNKFNIATESGFAKADVKLKDIKADLAKINDVTGYDGMFNNSNLPGKISKA